MDGALAGTDGKISNLPTKVKDVAATSLVAVIFSTMITNQ
jgi:hypothetical protein